MATTPVTLDSSIMPAAVSSWWQSLQPRERVFVGSLGVFLVVFCFYFLLLEPLFKNAKDYKAKAERAKSELQWMQAAVQNLPATDARRPNNNSNASLNVIVDQTRGRYRLVASNTQQVGPNQLRVKLDDAKFDDIVRWLGDLRRTHSITIDAANVSPTDVRGTTTASLTLGRPQN